MPEVNQTFKEYTSREPFSAEILVRKESHKLMLRKDNGYDSKFMDVDGGILLKITISAPTLEELQMKIAGHVALI